MSATNAILSNPQLLSDEEVAISADSAVVDQRSALQPQQVNESNDDALGIDSLPDEMIVEVFRHLSHNQLGRIARVCRRWSVLAKSPVLWKNVDVEIFCSSDEEDLGEDESFKFLMGGLPSCVTFIRLEFSRSHRQRLGFLKYLDFQELCMKLHHSCPNLEVLILTRSDMSNSLPEVINFCTQFLEGLKKLVFNHCRFRNHSGTEELKGNSNIEVLDLNCSDFSFDTKIQLSKLISLNELRLNGTCVQNRFVSDTSFLNQLQVLDLRDTRVTSTTFLEIQRRGQNLKELYFCGLWLRDWHLNFNNPPLKTICLCDTMVTSEGVVSLIRSCPSLVNVYIDERVARSFAEHPFVVANRCKSEIVKSITSRHDHNVDYWDN